MNRDEILNELTAYIKGLRHISAASIPEIELYMDQVTTFMEEHLADIKRYPEDKALTKTMINNYAKNSLLPPPVKKKYSKQHMLLLLFIYYYKGVLSLSDIETLLTPLQEKYFSSDAKPGLEQIYNEIFAMEPGLMEKLLQDLRDKFALSSAQFDEENSDFSQLPSDEREYLRLFAFVCELGYDVYLKKQLMEKIVDQLRAEAPKGRKK